MKKTKEKPTIIQKEQWQNFADKNIIPKLSSMNIGEDFEIPLNRGGVNNGLSDLGRDGSKGGVKIHAAFVDELHPEYSVLKVCKDSKHNKTRTHLKVIKNK